MSLLEAREPLWTGRYALSTIGVFSLAFLVAFESLAVATVMPLVAQELDGLPLYAVSFAAPMAVSVVTLGLAGAWCDRSGPAGPMLAGGAAFVLGIVVAGLAPTMEVFLVGRGVQGIGTGLVGPGLYVVIARAFPEHLRARVFAVLTSAWTLPALVGPGIAGWVAHVADWRWVFLGVPALAVVCVLVLLPTLRRASGGTGETGAATPFGWSVVAAAGVLAVTVAGQRDLPLWPVVLLVAVAAVVVAVPRLLPHGTWSGGLGLPSVLATRGLVFAGYFGAEAYLPLSLVERRGLSTAEAGTALTIAALTWFAGAWLAANWDAIADTARRVRIGTACVVVATLAVLAGLWGAVPVWLVVVGWSVGGFGMGMALSTLSVLVIELSPVDRQGANSAAMQVNDQVAQAATLAVGSGVFAEFVATTPTTGFVLVLVLAIAVAVAAFLPQRRLAPST